MSTLQFAPMHVHVDVCPGMVITVLGFVGELRVIEDVG